MAAPVDTGHTLNPVTIYAKNAAGALIPVQVDDSGQLMIAAILAGDLAIGAVELKNAADDSRAVIDSSGALSGNVTKLGGLAINLGAGAAGTGTQRVLLATDSPRGVASYSASAVFTPAAAEHVAGDVNGGAQEFTTVGPSAGRVKIVGASLLIAGGTLETTAWELHLFSVTPPSALADDAAFALASGDRASYLGFVPLAQVVDYGDSLYIENNSINKPIKLAGTSVFAYLVNRTTLTPAAVAHTVLLHTEAY